jgi:hypothetical protein
MDIQTLGILGFIFAATALARIAYERRSDVLFGHYLHGRAKGRPWILLWQPASLAIDRMFALEGPKMVYPTSLGRS